MSQPPTQKKYQSLSSLTKTQISENQYQKLVKPSYQKRIWTSDYQYQLYKTATLGLKAFSKKELYKMSSLSKKKILKFYKKAQIILNRWKQQLVNEMFEQLCSIKCTKFLYNPFHKVFNNTVIGVKAFGETTDDLFICTLTFTQLKITREQIIQKLIFEKILPENFYKLQKTC